MMKISVKNIQFYREPLLYGMSRCIMAARASGKNIIDGVHLDISDEDGVGRVQ